MLMPRIVRSFILFRYTKGYMDNLSDLLAHRSAPKAPEESERIKAYVQKTYTETCSVVLSEHLITIIVAHAALAATLHMELQKLRTACKIDKKIRIRIDS
jgi:hypothetical protein